MSIGFDENGKTVINTEVINDFNVIVYFEELRNEILFYIYGVNIYSQNEYRFYRKLQKEEIETIDSFDSKNGIWDNLSGE
ncbi:hypothetical protein [Sebaldella sp. S0638]|uniref:hypothetical protein n=1 Tax=Sebaldella sp. S0638 TaxID=2957809 RepID=UPI00209D5C6D|nr:hypothetical protein [Sebaldella sp. S0638]MCP1226580.1 hypothetical protein [Sebaldella sp. S0638]